MAIYGHPTYLSDETAKSVEKLLKEKVFVQIEETDYEIIPRVCNDNLVADQMLTIMYGFIVPDEVFDVFVADGSYSYWNGILDPVLVKEEGLLKAVMSVNDRLKTTDLHYEKLSGNSRTAYVLSGGIGIYDDLSGCDFFDYRKYTHWSSVFNSAGEDRGTLQRSAYTGK